MSLSDTLITDGNPASVILKDILRPSNNQSLGGVFSSGIYRAVNITDPITSPGLQMFYVEVLNATSSGSGVSNQLPFPGGLVFTKAYITLNDISPSAHLGIDLSWTGSNYTNFIVKTNAAISNQSVSFLIIGV
jgi:hypothetical protein